MLMTIMVPIIITPSISITMVMSRMGAFTRACKNIREVKLNYFNLRFFIFLFHFYSPSFYFPLWKQLQKRDSNPRITPYEGGLDPLQTTPQSNMYDSNVSPCFLSTYATITPHTRNSVRGGTRTLTPDQGTASLALRVCQFRHTDISR